PTVGRTYLARSPSHLAGRRSGGSRRHGNSEARMSSAREQAILAAAATLEDAWATGRTCAPVRDLLPPQDVAAAYEVQQIGTRRWLGEGRRLVGRKIGLTSVVVQKQLGVDQPDYG